MKDIVDVRLTVGYITLTRKQIEDALAELNKPEPRPFLAGERVEHPVIGIMLVLDFPSTNGRLDSIYVANLNTGHTFEVLKEHLKHLEMTK